MRIRLAKREGRVLSEGIKKKIRKEDIDVGREGQEKKAKEVVISKGKMNPKLSRLLKCQASAVTT